MEIFEEGGTNLSDIESETKRLKAATRKLDALNGKAASAPGSKLSKTASASGSKSPKAASEADVIMSLNNEVYDDLLMIKPEDSISNTGGQTKVQMRRRNHEGPDENENLYEHLQAELDEQTADLEKHLRQTRGRQDGVSSVVSSAFKTSFTEVFEKTPLGRIFKSIGKLKNVFKKQKKLEENRRRVKDTLENVTFFSTGLAIMVKFYQKYTVITTPAITLVNFLWDLLPFTTTKKLLIISTSKYANQQFVGFLINNQVAPFVLLFVTILSYYILYKLFKLVYKMTTKFTHYVLS